ncbi:hypothetical protein EJB05_32845 [Eragrostis curvula]|uniref:Uncharacterized protein n=1 Tax=Eragrostis curvula TaxID=38414 RepID=A0A5J9UHV9_9POAL|nr:hypothetical protein EJB05_32845 [Eragrostis curvula]
MEVATSLAAQRLGRMRVQGSRLQSNQINVRQDKINGELEQEDRDLYSKKIPTGTGTIILAASPW